jgi:leucyl/phenylalanyl-tRNA---protein transferase
MTGHPNTPRLPWLEPGDAFPPVNSAWASSDPVPGLLAGGANLSVATLVQAYCQGIFPWYSAGQPILWWSPDPRMVLPVAHFKLHRSLRKTLQAFLRNPRCEIRIDHDFAAVISACANAPRDGQAGTWIVPEMRAAYIALHAAGYAHCIETWIDGKLAGGLYCTAVGSAVFGESMFAHAHDASKIALAALVALCLGQDVAMIDCQQNTAHLASLGALEIPRDTFCAHVLSGAKNPLSWQAKNIKWELLDQRLSPTSIL